MIEKERIEAIKRTFDLAAVIKSRGIQLKKNGKGHMSAFVPSMRTKTRPYP